MSVEVSAVASIILPSSVLLEDMALLGLGMHSSDSLYYGIGIGEGGKRRCPLVLGEPQAVLMVVGRLINLLVPNQ